MFTVRQLLESKGHEIWSVAPDAPVFAALELLAEKEIGALLVLEGDDLVGIVSERDYARKVALRGKTSAQTEVREIMTADVHVISPTRNLREVMELMTEQRIRHLPVVEEGKLLGLISIGDVVKNIIEQQEFEIDQLQNYITGSR